VRASLIAPCRTVFQHEAFAARMRAVVGDEERPSRLSLLAQAMPTLADYLHSMDARIEDGNSGVQEVLGGIEERVRAQGSYGAQLHQQLTSGAFTLQLRLADDGPSSWQLPSMLGLPDSGNGPGSSCYTSTSASLAPLAPVAPAAVAAAAIPCVPFCSIIFS